MEKGLLLLLDIVQDVAMMMMDQNFDAVKVDAKRQDLLTWAKGAQVRITGILAEVSLPLSSGT